MSAETPCFVCGFELWHPIAPTPELSVSSLALYDDARFPGRSILRLDTHKESIEELSPEHASDFIHDIQKATRAIKGATKADRVNVAVLGNAVPHVHAHLIPRYRNNEPEPSKSPWDDPRPKVSLTKAMREQLMSQIALKLN